MLMLIWPSLTDYDEHERSMLISQMSFEKTFGLSSVFIESTLMENGGVPESAHPSMLIKEAIHVISCGYEEKTAWGKEVLAWHIMSISLLVLRHAAYFFCAILANLATSQFFVRDSIILHHSNCRLS